MLENIIVFVLASFIGGEVISKVPQTLHTPLMSGSNAISGITIVGALVVAGMVGGVALNIVPNLCEVDFEIRNVAEDDPVAITLILGT